MKLRSIASPLTITSFLVVAITGLCMFFGYHDGLVKPVHELFSLIFVLGCALHVVVNGKATLDHLKRPPGAALAVLFLIVTVVAVVPQGDGADRGNPVRKSIGLIMDTDLSVVAALTKVSEPVLQERLRQNGCTVTDAGNTVRQIAAASNQDPMKVMSVLLAD